MTTKTKTRKAPAKANLDFDGMNIKIDVEKQREIWGTTFTSVQTAMRFCNFDHVKAKAAVRGMIETDDTLVDEAGSHWAESIEYLESVIAMMKAASARLELSEKRAKETP
jgi:hypothetical protein